MSGVSQSINYIHQELAWIQQQIIQKTKQDEMTEITISQNDFVTDDDKYYESYGEEGLNEKERQYRMADEKNSEYIDGLASNSEYIDGLASNHGERVLRCKNAGPPRFQSSSALDSCRERVL